VDRQARRKAIAEAVRGFARAIYERSVPGGEDHHHPYEGQYERHVQLIVNAVAGGCDNDSAYEGRCPVHPHGCPLPGADDRRERR
jgi:hypothetical protein